MARQGQSEKRIPFQFVLDQLEILSPVTKPMFGCTAVYVGEKIVLMLRDRSVDPASNGVWLATTLEHHESLRRELPTMRSIGVPSSIETGWQMLSMHEPGFEEATLTACELILNGDQRIGKIPIRKTMKPSIGKSKTRKSKRHDD